MNRSKILTDGMDSAIDSIEETVSSLNPFW